MKQARRIVLALASLTAVACVLLLPGMAARAAAGPVNALFALLLLAVTLVIILLLWEIRDYLLPDAPGSGSGPGGGGRFARHRRDDPFSRMLDALDEADRFTQATRERARRTLDEDKEEVARRNKWRWN